MPKAAIYARVSTEGQADEEVPINGQIDECRKFAAEKGWEVAEVFTDAGFSGRTDDRPAFRRMIEIIKSSPNPKPFDIILCWRSNRLFRSVEHRLAYSRVFRRHSIRFVAMHEPEFEGASAMFMETVLAAADELYVSQVSEDTLRGLKQIAMAGYSTGGKAATGYRNVRKVAGLKPNGEPILRTGWEPDPDYAPKIKRAFEMCANGASGPEIIKATGVVTSPSSLVSLLRNRAYLGERIYNVMKQVDGKTRRRANSKPEDIIKKENAHEAIISPELFVAVQDVLARRRPDTKGKSKQSPQTYLLTGLLWCSEHQALYTGNTNSERNYYICSAKRKLGAKISPCRNVKKETMEEFILDNLQKHVFTEKRIRAGLEAIAREKMKNSQEDDRDRKDLTLKINQVEIELKRFFEAIASGVNPENLAQPIEERSALKNKLYLQLAEIDRQRDIDLQIPDITDTMVEDIQEKYSNIFLTSPEKLKAILPQFIERIELDGTKAKIKYFAAEEQKVGCYWRPQGDSNPRSPP
ncbi:recombinase family protein [Dehalococcoides mccartyi]|uniref:recombinase family protein n=1 Tax=Dehalococcoides mccartyi TaxID=61435 RepID=UPI00350E41D1